MKFFDRVLPLLVLAPTLAHSDITTITRARANGDIKVAANGDVFVSDFGNPQVGNGDSVVRIFANGSQEVFADGLGRALAGLDFDTQGNLIQAAFNTNRIYRIDADGNGVILATNLQGPVGIAVDSNNDVYATECNSNAIARVDSDGAVTRIASGGGLSCPNGMDIGHDGALYVVNFSDGGMYRVSLDGSISLFANIPGGGNGHVVFVNNRYYVAGRVAHRVFEVDTDGNVSAFAGTGTDGNQDGPNLDATISRPNGIGASPDGRFLYVTGSSDFGAADVAIRRIDLPSQGSPFEINAGLNGAWFNQATPGQGFLLDVVPSTGTVFLAWFTFETIDAKIGFEDQRWFTAQGPYQANRAEMVITLTSGGAFDDPLAVTNATTGTATLIFDSCTEASFDYAFDVGTTGRIVLSRLTPDALCSALVEPDS